MYKQTKYINIEKIIKQHLLNVERQKEYFELDKKFDEQMRLEDRKLYNETGNWLYK